MSLLNPLIQRLIYDVTNNGGGQLLTAYIAVAAVFPGLMQPRRGRANASDAWLNQYDRRIGPVANYMANNNLLYDGGWTIIQGSSVQDRSMYGMDCSVS